MSGFLDFLNGAQQPATAPIPAPGDTAVPQNGSYASLIAPQDPAVAQIMTPATDPVQIEQRRQGWMQVIQQVSSNPNLMRAIGMFGASLSQPPQWGQSPMGQFGQAYTVGRSAFDFGELAQEEQTQRAAEETRKQAESTSLVGYRRAQTAQTEATTRKTTVEADVAESTKQDAISKIQSEAERAKSDASKAKDEATRSQILLKYEQRVAAIREAIPDPKIRASLDAELEKAGLTNEKLRAETGKAKAEAGEAGAKAGYYGALKSAYEAGVKNPPGMGRKGTQSAQVQAANLYKAEWQKANPKMAGESDEQYETRSSGAVTTFMTQAKKKDRLGQFVEFLGKTGGGSGDFMKDWDKWNELLDSIENPEAPKPNPDSKTKKIKPSGGWGAVRNP